MLITGNTYPIKEALKKMGGKWDAIQKGWDVPDDRAEEAQALVARQDVHDRITQEYCAECGKPGRLVRDEEDGLMKHYRCCDIPPIGDR